MSVDINIDDILKEFNDPQPIGRGGQKIVFIINHEDYGRCVLKIGFYSSNRNLQRIEREVGVLTEMESEYYPTHYLFRVIDKKRFIILEELLEGSTLDTQFNVYSDEKSALQLTSELIKALNLLWDQNIVHRDLKPKNIIITEKGPRIIDLGIARLLNDPSITDTIAPFGPCTPEYASPEQLKNRKKDIDFRTDQFSLGIILTQLLLKGKHPFSPELVGGDSIPANILSGNWDRDYARNNITKRVLTTIDRMIGREPYQRFRKVEDLMREFDFLARILL